MPYWFTYLFVAYLASVRPPAPTATALLNNAKWFGKAVAWRIDPQLDKPCTEKEFGLNLVTDIPHSRGSYDRKAAVTGCMKKCWATQFLSFSGIPLAVGRYTASSLKRCAGAGSPLSYLLLDGGDVKAEEFLSQTGWIEVSAYNPATKEIEGKFEVTLKSNKGEIMQFSEGIFKTRLTNQ
ncbi:hypothetical protein GCM10023187_20660 [Nibrella viscosa]|uniref:Uncharacterized protein n=1 Tax=Nibrella viscosa TaxID=1084524 RepID=A0ABP8KCT3_9BACT